MNDESRSANENETQWGPVHDADMYQMVIDMSALQGDSGWFEAVDGVLNHFQPRTFFI